MARKDTQRRRDEIDLAVDRETLADQGNPAAVLLEAVEAGKIAVLVVHDHKASWPKADLSKITKPIVVVVGDQEADVHPSRYGAAAGLRDWVRQVTILGVEPDGDTYPRAIRAAQKFGRAAIIETVPERVADWKAFLGCEFTFTIAPAEVLAAMRGDRA